MMTSSPPLLPQHPLRSTANIDFIVDLPNDSDTTTTTTTKTTTVIAFGSCHKNKYSHPQIWKSIHNENPISFLWTGDAIYPPIRNIAPLSFLQEEYTQMKYNHTIGYTQLTHNNNDDDNHIPIFGTWDDHDYGGNDRGNDMTQRMERARLFYQFINQSIPLDDDVDEDSHNSGDDSLNSDNNSGNTNRGPYKKKEREGIYYSVEFRHRSSATSSNTLDRVMDETPTLTTQTVRVLFLDTRYFRTSHCLPSLAGQFPLGAGIACLSRWFSAGMLQQYCTNQHSSSSSKSTILGTTQWEWLHQQIYNVPSPDILIVVSSIQVYTTNPAMEGWGHYPNELRQLSELLLYASRRSVVTILSGDVHHGEILTPFPPLNTPRNNNIHASTSTTSEQPFYLEVTSSGLTHDCSKHIYGIVCEPLLRTFHQHRYQNIHNYYIGRNYGTISIDWMNQNVSINVHDAMTGTIQLSTGSRPFISNSIDSSLKKANNTYDDTNETLLLLNIIIPCMDNHLVPHVYRSCMIIVLLIIMMMLYSFRIRSTGKRTSLDNNVGDKKKKS